MLFGKNKNNNNNEEDLVNQDDLVISSDEPIQEESSPELELRDTDENPSENREEFVQTNAQSQPEGGFGFEEFINTFAEGKQEEVILSDSSIKLIKEDIVLEKTKQKFKFSYIVIAIVFIVLIGISIFTAYIAANYSIVWGYNVEEADYYFESPVRMSVIPKEAYCDTKYLTEGMDVLYYEGDIGFFTKYKKFRVDDVNKTNVFGYDYSSGEKKNIVLWDIYYIIDSRK